MEKESFEDAEIAKLMNEAFVSIKIDREERPDVDSTYMAVCQIMTGSGGWPLTIIMTPDKKPFFASTYIPKEGKFGRIGMKELIPRIRELWNTKRDQLANSAQEIVSRLIRSEQPSLSTVEKIGEETLDAAYDSLSDGFDEEYGGFGGSPKFPTPHHLTFLLRYWKRTGYEKALWMVEKTLTSMRLGGIYDQVGYGFHRYSVDSRWFLPHFEKMLYDQAMLAMAYTETYQATKKEEYRSAVEEILAFVLHDMTSPEGGFYTSIDADSEGQEGKYYLWSEKEVREVLSQEESDLIIKIFNIRQNGNLHDETSSKDTGKNILYMSNSLKNTALEMRIPLEELEDSVRVSRRKLLRARETRIHPQTDEKILADLNGLMIAALAKAAQALNEPRYCFVAEKAAEFLLNKMRNSDGRLLHRYKDSETLIPGFLDDFAFLIWGLIELYEATFKARYLMSAVSLTELMISHFSDEQNGGVYVSADDAESIIVRRKDAHDGAHPSGYSVAALDLLLLAHITGKSKFEDLASSMIRLVSSKVASSPTAFTHLLAAVDFALGPSSEIVIVGDPKSEDTEIMLKMLRSGFLPNNVQLLKPIGTESREVEKLVEFTRDFLSEGGRATAFVCQDHKCNLPTTDARRMLELLDKEQKRQ
jgi:hypothetical protein